MITRTTQHSAAAGPGGGDWRTSAWLLRVLRCDRLLEAPIAHRIAAFDLVSLDRGDGEAPSMRAEGAAPARRLRLGTGDGRMSSRHAELVRAGGRWVIRDLGSKNGTHVNGERTSEAALGDGDWIECGRTFWRFRAGLSAPDPEASAPGLDLDAGRPPWLLGPGLSTLLPPLAREMRPLADAARSALCVLIGGETGTGKELLARAVHGLSLRAGPFVGVNCGAITASLVESQLFGHRKGAFSDAREDRPGLVRAADGGTLFLDEIAELPGPAQAALLRVIQEREVLPVGATRPVPVNVKLVAATHRDLPEAVRRGSFRADLHARLSGYPVTLPPLRERREDLGLLLSILIGRARPDDAAAWSLSREAARLLCTHDFPMNIRQLEQSLTAACLRAGAARVIEPEHLLPALGATSRPGSQPLRASDDVGDQGDSMSGLPGPAGRVEREREQRDRLIALLVEHRGNVSAIAQASGKARVQIQRWLKRHGLDPDRYRR